MLCLLNTCSLFAVSKLLWVAVVILSAITGSMSLVLLQYLNSYTGMYTGVGIMRNGRRSVIFIKLAVCLFWFLLLFRFVDTE